MTPHFDLAETRLLSLADQRKVMSLAYGGKSANLGEVAHARLPNVVVPNGFTIPFAYYDAFLKENNLDDAISLRFRTEMDRKYKPFSSATAIRDETAAYYATALTGVVRFTADDRVLNWDNAKIAAPA